MPEDGVPAAFQRGMWEFTRVVDHGLATSRTLVKKKCTVGIESSGGGKHTEEILSAKRIGDC